MFQAANNSNFILFRFTWPDATETSIKVRLSKNGLAAAVTTESDPARVPSFELYRSISTMRAESQLFAAMHHCKLTVEEG